MALVGAARLADLGLVAGHVEDVVDDLEHDAELRREAPVRDCGRSAQPLQGQHARRPSAAISAPVFSSCRWRSSTARGLAAPRRGTGRRPCRRRRRRPTSSRTAASTLAGSPVLLGQRQAQRLGEQAVAGEDRDVLAVGHVAGRLAAAQLVVVHRRQVVVDQRVGVDHLDRGRQRQHLLGRRARAPRRSRGRAPGGCACRRRAASSASPPRAARCPARRRSAASRGSRRPGAGARPGRRAVIARSQQALLALGLAAPTRLRASSSAPIRGASSAQRSTRSAASSASIASERSLSATASSSAASSSSPGASLIAMRPPRAARRPRMPLTKPGASAEQSSLAASTASSIATSAGTSSRWSSS